MSQFNKSCKGGQKLQPFRKLDYKSTLIRFQKNANGARAFLGIFLCDGGSAKRFVKVHLHYIVRNLKKDKRNVVVGPLKKFLRTPMIRSAITGRMNCASSPAARKIN